MLNFTKLRVNSILNITYKFKKIRGGINMLPKISQRISQDPSAMDELLALSNNQQVISFAAGYPAKELFPKEQLEKAFVHRSQRNDLNLYQYASVDGYAPLRKKIAELVSRSGVAGIDENNLFLTQGAQQGISLLADLFLDVGDGVVVEGPSYIGALQAFETRKPTFYEMQMQNDGPDLDQLEEIVSHHPVKLVYTIPTFQNPTGVCMSLEKRKRIAQLAQKYNFLVIEDDPYRDLRYRGESLPPIKTFDQTGNVVLLGSFSKILSPALRVGWMVADPQFLQLITGLRSATDFQPSNVVLQMIDQYLDENDIQKHIDQIREVYGKRNEAMQKALAKYLPQGCSFSRPDGGFFIWVTLPYNISAKKILQAGSPVTFIESSQLYETSHQANQMRLNFTGVTEEQIEKGCKLLGEKIKNISLALSA